MVAEGFKSECSSKAGGSYILRPWYDLALLESFLLDSVDGPVNKLNPIHGKGRDLTSCWEDG